MITKHSLFYFIISLIFTTGSIFLAILTRVECQAFFLWRSIDYILLSGLIDFTLFFLIHNVIGATVFQIAFYQCLEIVRINNQAHSGKNQPNQLLQDGYYAVVRHPMTARFLLILFSFCFMMSSLISLFLYLPLHLFFLLITIYEEKRILYPMFGETYANYKEKVSHRFFNKIFVVLLILLSIFWICGSIFMLF
ncbi:MAG: hypothetical protein EU532_14815 [Promethearchaeota archaeon]|nr:MAG: hypothetical protein EU532_14815 [Candidatus Lokiarchaeota archaeon]